ncbi:MAG TPA: WecB/TagA/CpsF family glycosyltransferase [Longimicrobiaceae bacterium]|nr:WecB/TagA/CpsF family glycosyltransferase [Longimicrobiaceae bacterium]
MELSGSALEAPFPGTRAYHMLGARFDLMTRSHFPEVVDQAVSSGCRWVVGGHNMHSLHLYHRDPKMRRFYERSDFTFLDGMPLVWLARMLGFPARREHRHAPIDWMPPLLGVAAERGWRVFFLGSEPRVAALTAQRLRERFPGLQVETHPGYFDATPGSPEAEAVLARINEWRPAILAVCMGMPRQEHWIVDHLDRLEASVVFNLGALMELIAGELPIPPRWIGQVGLEWLYRLVSHPRRVWRRYLVEPWTLLPHLVRDLTTSRRSARADWQPEGK